MSETGTSTEGAPIPLEPGQHHPDYDHVADLVRASLRRAYDAGDRVRVYVDDVCQHMTVAMAAMTHPDDGLRAEWLVAADEQGRMVAGRMLPRTGVR